MTRPPTPLFACALMLLLLVGARAAEAAEGDLTLTAAQLSQQKVSHTGKGRVLLYGPVKLTPQLKDTKDVIYLYVDDVDFGGKAAAAEIFLVDPSKKKGLLEIDPNDYVGSMANVEGGREEARADHARDQRLRGRGHAATTADAPARDEGTHGRRRCHPGRREVPPDCAHDSLSLGWKDAIAPRRALGH